ncbi:hypothetical protein K440DRAFT_614535 [Wilcoxina mikolae CBS 423.85]|nr:hypothetical protein K440DRAFT_614535 [Wilcoxina mikolae CBS 423.85]
MNQEESVPMGHDQPHSQDDGLRNIMLVTHDVGEWTDDWLEPTKICGVHNAPQGIQSEDPNLANRGSVAEEAQSSGQTIDPRLTVIEWSDGQPSWVRHIGMGSPSDHAAAKTHRQFTSSLSDTISSLTSLSLDMPPEKRARKCPEFNCPHCSTTCTSQRKLE